MNERFVAVCTVTGSRIRGCFSKLRCDFSVTARYPTLPCDKKHCPES